LTSSAPCIVDPEPVFKHPGVLVTKGMLDVVRAKVGAGQEPWATAAAFKGAESLTSLTYKPTPRAVVECGSYSTPDYGCSDEKRDAEAAYTHALLWYIKQDAKHAEKAIEILDAWSAVIKDHNNSNAPLQAAWTASVFPRAAEIVLHTYKNWPAADRFKKVLTNVYLPKVIHGSTSNGNWELSMIEAILHISVFTENADAWRQGLELWRARVPAYLYLETDGATPQGQHGQPFSDKYWYNLGTFKNGVCQETCRDLGHVQYGLAAMVNAAETAHHQGVDLFGHEAGRMLAGLEFHANYAMGAAVPSWLCGGTLASASPKPMWEVAYNHFHGRRSQAMPYTEKLLGSTRPTKADHHMEWETLTHYGQGSSVLLV
jgi:hypothetical protein